MLNYAFLLFWSIFGEIHRELFFLDIKVTISEKWALKYSESLFSYHVWKGENPEENLDLFKQFYFIKHVKRINIKKTVFLHKVSHILLNYAFCCFEAFLDKFLENFSFKTLKWLSQKQALKNIESLFSLPCLKRGKSWGKFGFV